MAMGAYLLGGEADRSYADSGVDPSKDGSAIGNLPMPVHVELPMPVQVKPAILTI